MGRLEGKVAIITGSNSGVGAATAELFAKEGAKVVISARRQGPLDEVAEKIRANGGEVLAVPTDVSKVEDVENLVAKTVEAFGKIDILVNNAANVGLKDGRVDELTLEMWDAIFSSDMRGTFYATQCVLPYMQKNENGGSIINIGSMASCGGDLGSTAYACAKAGVNMLTQYTALQYGKQKIRCNCIRPGLIVTPENEANVPQVLKDIFLNNIDVDRYGCPEDIGHLCVYLASDESNYVTGQIMDVDGGMNSHVPTVGEFKKMSSRTW